MKIQCPSCDQRLEIPEELAGQTIECPACNASLAVPSLATPPPSPVQVQQSAPQVTASEKPKSSIPKWAIAAVAAAVAVGTIMIFSDTKIEPVTEAAQTEPPIVVAPEISIHEAAKTGNIEAVKQHLAAGSDVNEQDRYKRAPLHYAATEGHKEIVGLLISKSADVNEKWMKGRTALFAVAQKGHKEIAELLIDSGANVNSKGEEGLTPLHITAMFGRPETAELLIAKGADVNIKDNENETPLDKTIISKILPEEYQARFKETADLLRAHGAKATENKNTIGIPITQRPDKVIPKELLAYVRDQNVELIIEDKEIVGLDLEGKNLTAKLLANLVKFNDMEFLILDSTNITDEGLKEIAKLTNLKSLWLDFTEITDVGLAELANLKNLEDLDIEDINVRFNQGLKSLEKFSSLKSLELINNGIGDECIESLSKMKNLDDLEIIEGNNFSSRGLRRLKNALPECQIH